MHALAERTDARRRAGPSSGSRDRALDVRGRRGGSSHSALFSVVWLKRFKEHQYGHRRGKQSADVHVWT